jgi:hypothetical protein
MLPAMSKISEVNASKQAKALQPDEYLAQVAFETDE